MAEKKSEDAPAPRRLTSVRSVAISHDRNARFRRTMEDTHKFVDGLGGVDHQGFFGIYDGHGGRRAAEFVADHLHENFLAEMEKGSSDMGEVWLRAYTATDNQIGEADIQYSGTTVVTAFVRRDDNGTRKLYTANCGDARAVLNHGGTAVRVTHDHKGTDDDEIERIKEAGGFVVNGRVNAILAVTRSLGDRAMKQFVTGDPYTEERDLGPEDTHLVLACDGVWDVLSDQEVIDIVKGAESCGAASKEILIASLRAGSMDNISVMVVAL
eukprot:TRINITY_DN20771_c0_g1_i1.p1 TRINITY_DN20771_c0_g1~~TRINITY_DN20771_c0_g1_i1.p1  ORF type:complete len:306 (-),score=75.21 TRINITY_DN20771_c0_g1_i1:158-964(-)